MELASSPSHILAQLAGILSKDWQHFYNHPVYYLETFVDTECFKGTCYKAANWIYLGKTTGRGKNDQTGKQNRSLKAVYGYPLTKDFRAKLAGARGMSNHYHLLIRGPEGEPRDDPLYIILRG